MGDRGEDMQPRTTGGSRTQVAAIRTGPIGYALDPMSSWGSPIQWKRTYLVPQHALQPVLSRASQVDGQRGSTSLHHHHGLREELLRQAHHHLGSTSFTVIHLRMELSAMDSSWCLWGHFKHVFNTLLGYGGSWSLMGKHFRNKLLLYVYYRVTINRTSCHRWMELFRLCFLGLYPIHKCIISR